MKFKALQEQLRAVLRKRIEKGKLTGLKLAHETGFQQAHISNFLNSKRSLSLEGMDKVLQVQQISVLDLLDPKEINKRASIVTPSPGEFEDVVMADAQYVANDTLIINDHVRDTLKFKKSFLRRLKPAIRGNERAQWTRFVLLKIDTKDALSMYPRLNPGCVVLIDRHYNTIENYRKNEANLYAVRKDGSCVIKYVELAQGALVLRPHNQTYPVTVIPVAEGEDYGEHIVGRVCHIGVEV